MIQIQIAVEIAEAKYPKNKATNCFAYLFRAVVIPRTADALNANKMNARPGSQQPLMHDTIWKEELQSLTRQVTDGHPLRNAKGLIEV